MKEVRFGIIGTGSIAARFARACALTPGVRAAGIASRSAENGARFAAENGVERVYLGAQALAASPEIDIVYVATPHTAHFETCMTALQANKPVLCEKPMATRRADAEALFAEAKRRGLFCMEGMWSRFLPNSRRAKDWIGEGRIGAVRFIDGMFSFAVDPVQPKPRLVEPSLGGGAMFDVGVYTVEMASYYAGEDPCAWSGFCTPYRPGTDAASILSLRYPGGVLATLRMGITCEAPPTMTVYGEKGRIEISRFFSAPEVRLYVGDALAEQRQEQTELPAGFCPQIAAVRDHLLAGETESPVVPASATIAAARIMEDMMHQFFPEFY